MGGGGGISKNLRSIGKIVGHVEGVFGLPSVLLVIAIITIEGLHVVFVFEALHNLVEVPTEWLAGETLSQLPPRLEVGRRLDATDICDCHIELKEEVILEEIHPYLNCLICND